MAQDKEIKCRVLSVEKLRRKQVRGIRTYLEEEEEEWKQDRKTTMESVAPPAMEDFRLEQDRLLLAGQQPRKMLMHLTALAEELA
ncbi:hypothetical protein CRG98_026649 [Punica granatum]|uniref:Uncharacterized protein n=1 Tax=Punica granatum TaxID=22663 RepID=A0A2I0JAD8_PUNGR|nr:hypothetical protein CRG98_026649 [Punica granatum]